MVFWTLKWIIISVMLIFLMHHLFTFFKDTLTVPKTKDLVQPIFLPMSSTRASAPLASVPVATTHGYVPVLASAPLASAPLASAPLAPAPLAPAAHATQAPDSVSMQNELQQFLRDLKKPI